MRLLILTCLLAANLIGWAQKGDHVPGELIIQLQQKVDPVQFIRSFEAEHQMGINGINCLSEIAGMYQITFANHNADLNRALQFLNRTSEVQGAQKNHYVTSRETIPNDLLFAEQWFLKNTGTDGGVVDADIDATDAWDITTGGLTTHGDTIVVCVIEGNGVDISHEDLQGNLWKNHAEIPGDGIDNDGNGYVDDYDGWNVQTNTDEVGSGSHGTRVSGMIGAKGNNEIGISGVNWNVKMMIVKGQQASNEASVIAAYSYPLEMRKRYNDSYGEEGAFVVATNASWGRDNKTPEDSPLWCAMYDTLGKYGIISVGATTNNNLNVEVSGDLPTNCTSPYFIGVTMSNSEDLRANSGYGTTSVDLAAPGHNVRLPIPGDSYSSTSGTSFATPCVTGSIALAYSAPCPEFINLVKFDPATAALQMRDYILDGVDLIPSLASETVTGGRLNINNSILLMLDDCDEGACISPFNMRVSEISDTGATITWEGFSSDFLLTITPEGEAPVTIPVGDAFTGSFDTLQPCTNYTFTVTSVCGEDEFSEPSFEVSFTTDGCCTNPPLFIDSKTESELSVTWNPILYATQYNFRYRENGSEDWIETENAEAPFAFDGLAACTEYDCQIYTLCGDSTRGYSETYKFRTLGCGACVEQDYCPVIGAQSDLEWIDTVRLNGVTKGTGNNAGWLQSEQIITALTPDNSYPIMIKPGFASSSFTERYSIYIDFNQNGEFDLPEERVMDEYTTLGTVNQIIFIPVTANIGVTKMRIGMNPLNEPIACPTSNFYGEYEDYCVYIGPQAGIDEESIDFSLYPNPATNQLTITSSESLQGYKIFTHDGRLVANGNLSTLNTVDISNLATGMYLIQITTEKGTATQKFIKN